VEPHFVLDCAIDSGDTPFCGGICVLLAIRNSFLVSGIMQCGVNCGRSWVLGLHWLHELLGSLQLWDGAKLVLSHFPTSQVPHVHSLVSSSSLEVYDQEVFVWVFMLESVYVFFHTLNNVLVLLLFFIWNFQMKVWLCVVQVCIEKERNKKH
jgi:hypothetical protein